MAQIVRFPQHLVPIRQGDDAGDTSDAMGRGALHITITLAGTAWHVVTAHLKSKLLSFPGGRFAPTDEDERARFGAYALIPAGRQGGHGAGRRDPDPARPGPDAAADRARQSEL